MFAQLCYSLVDMITNPTILTSLILLALGLALSILAKRITRAVRKTADISSDDKLLLLLRAIGVVLMILGLFLMIFGLTIK